MLTPKKSALLLGLSLCLLLPACANSPWARNVERSLAQDPSLEDGSLFGGRSSPDGATASSGAEASLPSNFPAEIPRYPNAEFVSATQPGEQRDLAGAAAATQTRWTTADTAEQVQQFYREQFQSNDWQLEQPAVPTTNGSPNAAESPSALGAIVAERDGLQVSVAVASATAAPTPANSQTPANSETPTNTPASADRAESNTEFTIDYQFSNSTAESPSPSSNSGAAGSIPAAGNNQTGNGNAGTTFAAEEFTDLNQAPTELQPYIADLAKIGALRLQASNDSSAGAQFQPNSAITRREYARWLVTANNLVYANQPARQIRLAVSSDRPAFQDVSASDPDFATIQGLANAGLIPSPLSGDSTTVTFRPDAPLTRENLILWKVPVDLRKALPNATIESVQQTWGFQDTAQVDGKALRALLADFQNGDQSNIRRAFGYTTIFQPDKSVTRAEAAAALWFFGTQGDGVSAKDVLQPGQQGG